MEAIQKIANYAPPLIMLGIFIYDRFRKPEVKLEKQTETLKEEVSKMQTACGFRHQAIDDNILLIKQNHLKHIEEDVSSIKGDIATIKENNAVLIAILKEKDILKS